MGCLPIRPPVRGRAACNLLQLAAEARESHLGRPYITVRGNQETLPSVVPVIDNLPLI